MKFALALNLSPETSNFAKSFNQLSEEISSFMVNRNYGNDIKELYVGVICVSEQFEPFFKPKKPRYIREENIYEKDGVKYKLYKTFQYEIKLNFNIFKSIDQNSANKKLAHDIIESISVINRIKGIKDFEYERFKADLERFFKEKDLI